MGLADTRLSILELHTYMLCWFSTLYRVTRDER